MLRVVRKDMEEYIKRIVDVCADEMEEYAARKDRSSMWISCIEPKYESVMHDIRHRNYERVAHHLKKSKRKLSHFWI
jgi:hypothetical protein